MVMDFVEPAEQTGVKPATTVPDRRRPGRPATVSPALIELLRWSPPPAVGEAERKSDLSAAQGILLGILAGLSIWAGIYFLIALTVG
jgi:hypothetical protein